jgi:uncharacterized membrane protein
MLDVIFIIKFVHMIAMAVMFGTWVCIAAFMLFAYRSRNASVAAVTVLFAVRAELMLMIPAIALQPLAGFPLAVAIGERFDEYWMEASVIVYVAVVVVWLANLIVELRMRKVTEDAVMSSMPLPASYRRMFLVSSTLTAVGLAGMLAIMALMIWQPHWD